jgi:hypothetical protein
LGPRPGSGEDAIPPEVEVETEPRGRARRRPPSEAEVEAELSHPVLMNKAGCISYMRQEDNIYNNRVYRDKCHIIQSSYYIAEDLLQNKRINIKQTKDRRRQCQLRNAT